MDKVDFSDPLFFLNVIGMHPFKTDKFSKIRQTISILIYVGVNFFGVLELIFNSQGLETYARASSTMVPQYQVKKFEKLKIYNVAFQLICKIFVLIYHRESIAQLLKDSERFWPLDKLGKQHQPNFAKTHNYLKKFFLLYKVMITFTCLQFVAVKIIFKNPKPICISFGESQGLEPKYDNMYLMLHFSITLVSINLVNGFDGLFFYFIGHILTELKMVKTDFGDYPVENNWTDQERFKFAIIHHSFVLE